MPNAVPLSNLEGMHVRDVAAIAGRSVNATRKWLSSKGYSYQANIIRRVPSSYERERTIQERMAAAAPSAPCFRCGAARHCEHRPAPEAL